MTAQVKPLSVEGVEALKAKFPQSPVWDYRQLVDQLFATISDRDEKLRVASAREAVLWEVIERFGYTSLQCGGGEYAQECLVCKGATAITTGGKRIGHEDDCPLKDPSPAAQALLDELDNLRTEYPKVERLWKEASVARDDFKQQMEAKDALWMGAVARAEAAESANSLLIDEMADDERNYMARIKELEANARTPRTVEVCEKCRCPQEQADGNHIKLWEACRAMDCPISGDE